MRRSVISAAAACGLLLLFLLSHSTDRPPTPPGSAPVVPYPTSAGPTASGGAPADAPPTSAGVAVVVVVVNDSGAPVTGAEVGVGQRRGGVLVTERRGETGADGEVVLSGLCPGVAGIDVRHEAFDGVSFESFVPEAGFATERVVLESGPEVRGRVVDSETGAPVPRARVEIWPGGRSTVAGAAGSFSFSNFTKGVVQLLARAPGYAASCCYVPWDLAPVIRMQPALTLTGRLVDAAGEPVAAGAVLCSGTATGDRTEQHVLLDLRGRCAEDGTFALEGLRERGRFALTCDAPGFGRTVFDFDPAGLPRDGRTLDAGDVVLPRGAAITGVLVDAAGVPVPNARVSALFGLENRGWIGRDGRTLSSLTPVWLDDTTGAEGRFVIAPVGPGRYLLEARPGLAFPARMEVIVPAAGDPAPVTMALRDGTEMAVTVLAPEGRPLPGAHVVAGYVGDGGHGVTDDAGRVVFTGIPWEVVDLTIDVRPRRAPGRQEYMQTVWTVALSRREVTIRLRPMAWITGVCVDAERNPLPFVGIRVATMDPTAELGGVTGMADRDGRFELSAAPGARVALAFEAQARNPATGDRYLKTSYRRKIFDIVAPQEDLVVVMDPVGTDRMLDVLALDEAGEPLAGAEVRAEGPVKVASGRTGPDGRVLLSGVEAGHVQLVVEPGPASPRPVVRVPYREVVDSRETGSFVARLRPCRMLRGTVVGPSGRPVAGAKVGGMATGEDGGFDLPMRSDRREVVTAIWTTPEGEWLMASAWVEVGETEVHLRLGHGLE